jgi:hypothetical protein
MALRLALGLLVGKAKGVRLSDVLRLDRVQVVAGVMVDRAGVVGRRRDVVLYVGRQTIATVTATYVRVNCMVIHSLWGAGVTSRVKGSSKMLGLQKMGGKDMFQLLFSLSS